MEDNKNTEGKEDDMALTTGNADEIISEEASVNDTKEQVSEETIPKKPKKSKSKKKSKDDNINEFGTDIPVIHTDRKNLQNAGPSYVVINRAAILWLAGRMTPADFDDFKVAFPSLFK